jgi:hypothetical protein
VGLLRTNPRVLRNPTRAPFAMPTLVDTKRTAHIARTDPNSWHHTPTWTRHYPGCSCKSPRVVERSSRNFREEICT